MNFNPAMMEQFKNMDPSMLKTFSDMMGKMSDDDLKNYSKMAGMPQMSPDMLRNSANMMKNMDASQLNQMKDMAGKMGPGGMPGMPGMGMGGFPSSGGNTPTNSAASQIQSSGQFPKIEKLKNDGNDFFKKQKYDDASASYFEAILEIEELRMRKDLKNLEIDQLEVSCRLNYCNAKAKLNDYEIVLNQAKQVLKIQDDNAKGLFRLGQAYFHLKKYEIALTNLEKAYVTLNTDQTVKDYIDKARNIIAEQNPKPAEPTKVESKTETQPKSDDVAPKEDNISTSKPDSAGASKIKKKKEAPNPDNEIVNEIINKKNDKHSAAAEKPKSSSHDNHHTHTGQCNHDHPDVKIEEEKSSVQTTPSTSTNRHAIDEKLLKGQQEMKNMSSDQMRTMTDYLKNMDSSFIQQMLKSQTGMDMSESDIANFKKMMTPETMETFAKMDPAMLQSMKGFGAQAPTNTTAGYPQLNETTTATTSQGNTLPTFPTQPDLASMGGLGGIGSMLSSDAMTNMVDMMSKNPQMLQGMMGMLGDKHPLASMLKDKKPEDLAKYMGYLSKFLKVAGKASPVFSFIKNYWKYMLGLLIAYIVYRYI